MNAIERRRTIVIIGGGVIGACSAYYLTRHPLYDANKHSIVVLEATSVAGGSSGKAGGMLATYAIPDCLSKLSFQLHGDLAEEHDGTTWGYRRIPCAEFNATGIGEKREHHVRLQNGDQSRLAAAEDPAWPDWIRPESISSYREVGDSNHTAQVHPYLFTNRMLDLARERGAQVILSKVVDINYSSDKKHATSVDHVRKDTGSKETLPATDIILAAGPWTPNLLPQAPIQGARSHSIVIKPTRPVSGFALWPDITPGSGGRPEKFISPEIYSRPDGLVYSCGPTDYDVPLPATSDKVAVNNDSCSEIFDAVGSISNELDRGSVSVRQACYRPIVVIDGKREQVGPLLGQSGTKGLLMAVGHDSWGIQNSAATGKIMSEMVFDGKSKSADISSLDPRKFLNIYDGQ